jgi:succinoglycan biosynthesis protein ExoL
LVGNVILWNSSATEHTDSGALKVLVLAQDLADVNIQRRIAMLCAGGAHVTVAGFRRVPHSVENVSGCRTVDFGRTAHARFLQRIIAVVQKLISLRRHKALFADADVIIARNLDMLVIGTRGRSLCRPRPVLFYEVLDIHPLMLNKGPVGLVLRWLERQLSRRVAAILTSSPAFVSHYFRPLARLTIPIRLVENKVLHINEEMALCEVPSPRRPGPPWVIGFIWRFRKTHPGCSPRKISRPLSKPARFAKHLSQSAFQLGNRHV